MGQGQTVKKAAPRIDILMTGQTLPAIRERHGDFDLWFQEQHDTLARFRVRYLFDSDPIPVLSESDGWIITGASVSVNDDLPWLPAVQEDIRRAIGLEHPILGVCFGHQLLAVAAGGRVAPNPRGWELGSAAVELTPAGTASPLFQGMDARIPVYQTHQEVVTDLPAGAQVLAENEMGVQAMQVGPKAFGVQFHPEFTAPIARMYVELRRECADGALQEPDTQAESSRQVITNFIHSMTL